MISAQMRIWIILCAALMLRTACTDTGEVTRIPEDVPVRVRTVTQEVMRNPVVSSGISSRKEEIKLSFKIGGIVQSIGAREGVFVRKGDLLASLEMTEIKARTNQAREGFEKAKRDFKRLENLYRDSVVTREQYQNAESALKNSESELEIAEYNLRHSAIHAPAPGHILKKLAEESELVQAGQPVFLFSNTASSFIFRAGVTDRDVVKLANGDSAVITFDALPGICAAAVGEMPAGANQGSGLYDVELVILHPPEKLLPGMYGTAEIYPDASRSYPVIPVEALVNPHGDKGSVYILDGGYARKREVRIGPVADDRIYLVSGVSAGDIVISEGALYIRDGSRVKIVRSGAE